MNNRDQHIVNSLRRWIQGDIDQKEENRLDHQAREDDFLGEALEGYRRFPASNHGDRLERMREQLQKNTQRRKPAGLLLSWPYRVAAAAAVLLAVGLFWWLNPAPRAELAAAEQQESRAEERDDAAELSTETTAADAPLANTEPAAEMAPRPMDGRGNSAGLPQAFADTQATEQVAATSEERPEMARSSSRDLTYNTTVAKPKDSAQTLKITPFAREQEQVNRVDSAPAVSLPSAPPAPPPPPTSTKPAPGNIAMGDVAMDAPRGTRLITGQVLDQSGMPLTGVLVVTPGDRTGTITNLNGQYEILLDSNVQRLEFQRTGYSPQQIDISSQNDFVRVTLDQSATTVDQMIEAEESAKRRQKNRVNPSVSGVSAGINTAEPIGGFRRFDRYLEKSLNYPQEAIEREVSGQVTLSFTITPDGRVINVRVLQTPGPELVEEAMRLLQNGPKWKISNGSQENIPFTYRLNFSLY